MGLLDHPKKASFYYQFGIANNFHDSITEEAYVMAVINIHKWSSHH